MACDLEKSMNSTIRLRYGNFVWRILSGFFLFIALYAPSIAQTGETKQPRDITLGTPGEFPPYFLRDEKGRLCGFVVDLMDRIAEQSGFNMNYIVFKSGKEAQAKLLHGDVDIIGLGITNNRKQDFAFTVSFHTNKVSLFVRGNSTNIRGIDDLAGRKVGVVEANVEHKMVNKRNELARPSRSN